MINIKLWKSLVPLPSLQLPVHPHSIRQYHRHAHHRVTPQHINHRVHLHALMRLRLRVRRQAHHRARNRVPPLDIIRVHHPGIEYHLLINKNILFHCLKYLSIQVYICTTKRFNIVFHYKKPNLFWIHKTLAQIWMNAWCNDFWCANKVNSIYTHLSQQHEFNIGKILIEFTKSNRSLNHQLTNCFD